MNTDTPPRVPPARRRNELARLRRLTLRDELTGLANRRAFLQRLDDELARVHRNGGSFALVLLDLDGLKDLNDTFGHQAGDEALRQFARALRRVVRAGDLVARVGGDEFAVIARTGTADDTVSVATRLRRIANGFVRHGVVPGQPVLLSATWGMATCDAATPDAETLFARAESDLLAAKQVPAGPVGRAAERVYRPRGRRALGEELRQLLAMARHVSTAGDLEALCRTAAEQAAALVGARQASVALLGADGRAGYDARLVDGRWVATAEPRYAPGEGVIGWVMATGRAYLVTDVAADPHIDRDAAARLGIQGVVALPLRASDGRSLGVLSLANKHGGYAFTAADVELGQAFADLVAASIEQVQARAEAEAAHAYVRRLMDQAQDAIYITDPETRRILDVNEAAEALSGYTRAELLTMRAPDLRPPEDRDTPGTTDLALAGTGVVTLPRRHLRKDGRIVPVEVSARLVQTPRGAAIVHIARDVSERVQAEQDLRRRNRELEARNAVAALLARRDGDDPTPLARVLQIIAEVLAVDGALIARADPATGVVRVTDHLNLPEPLHAYYAARDFRLNEAFVALVAEHGVLLFSDLERHAVLAHLPALGVQTFAGAALIAHGRMLGVLLVGRVRPVRFQREDVALLRAVADQTALWLAHGAVLAEVAQRERDARFVSRLGEALNRTRGLHRIVRLLADETASALGMIAGVALAEPETGRMHVAAVAHPDPRRRRRILRLLAQSPPALSVAGTTALVGQMGAPVVLDADDPRLPADQRALFARAGVGALLVMPLWVGARLVGVLAIGAAPEEPALGDRHRALAEDIARHAAVAIANARARRDLLRRNRALRLIGDVTRIVQQAPDAATLYGDVVRRIGRAFPRCGVTLRLWDAERRELPLVACHGLADELAARLRERPLPAGRHLAGRVATSRRPFMTADLAADPRLLGETAVDTNASVMAVPLLSGDDFIGTLAVSGARRAAFDRADLRLLTAVAGPLAAALARLSAYDRSERSARWARALFDSAGDAIFVVDPLSRRIVDANREAEALTGYARAELVGMPGSALRPPDEPHGPTAIELTLKDGRYRSAAPQPIRRKDGTLVPVDLTITVADTESGQAILSIARDAGERTRHEGQLRFQSQVLASLREAVWTTDREGTVTYWGRGAEELFGWPAEEMVGGRDDALIPPGEQNARTEGRRRALAGETWSTEGSRLRRDGAILRLSMRFGPLRDEGGAIVGVIVTAHDITARHAAEAAVVAARDEAARRAAEFAAAARVGSVVAGGGDPDMRLRRLAAHIADVTGFDIVTLAVYDERAGVLEVRCAHRRGGEVPPSLRRLEGSRIRDAALASVRGLLERQAPDIVTDAHRTVATTVPPGHWIRAERVATLVRWPLTYERRPVGVLALASCTPRRVGADELRLCTVLADQAAVAVHTALEQDRLQDMRRDAILRLAAACEARDRDTGHHLRSIHRLTHALARELGHTEADAEELALAGVLHDVGKIRTPDAVLRKPGPLTAEERRVMRLHTVHGEAMLAGPDFYRLARQAARSHHERWDGSGYPDGLVGLSIPEPARIVAVADVFDALITSRVYKPAWPVERAVREIIAQSGSAFDPRVVGAFEALWRSGRLPERERSDATLEPAAGMG
jgi:diguanylate cyclase (GGDEF)-like protein/PAS domain S-box-containing protein